MQFSRNALKEIVVRGKLFLFIVRLAAQKVKD